MSAPAAHDLLAVPAVRRHVDLRQFRAILRVKLLLDARRRHGWAQGVGRVPPIVWSFGVHVLIGLGLAVLPLLVPSPLTALTLVHSVVMLMLAFDLVADYSSVLLDPADATLLGAAPVSPRTQFAARAAHVGLYLVTYVGALAVGTCVTGTMTYGALFLPVHLLSLLGAVGIVLSAVTATYLALMRLTSPDRMADLVMWGQIAMTALTVGGYYALTTMTAMQDLRLDDAWWIWLWPPAWLAGAGALAAGEPTRVEAGLALLALAGPIAIARAALRLAPLFRTDRPPERMQRSHRPTGRLARRLARLLVRDRAEGAAFELLWTLVARDRQFKTRTYPALAAITLFVAAFVLAAQRGAWGSRVPDLAATDLHMFLLYYTLAVLPTPLLTVPYADRPEAAWIHRALPVERPGVVLLASLKVLLVRLVAPVFTMIALAVLGLWGPRIVPDVVLAGAVMLAAACWLSRLIGRRLPFSEPPPSGAASSTVAVMSGYMVLVILAGGAHWLLAQVEAPLPQPWPLLLAAGLLLLAARTAAQRHRATTWNGLAGAR